MYRFRLLIGVAALFCAAVITGCVDTADNRLSEMEQDWARVIGDSYPGYRIPKTMPPAVRGSVIVEESAKPADTASVPAAPSPDSDPAAMVDKAAADTAAAEVVPEPKEQAAPVPVSAEKKETEAVAPSAEVKDAPAEKSEAKSAEKKEEKAVEAEADVKADAKAAPGAGTNAEAVVKAGDTLTGLAKEFYGDAKYYDVILKANPQIKNPKRLKIGAKLVIPAL